MMPKNVTRLSGALMLYLFDLEANSDFRSFDLKSSGSMDKTRGRQVLFLEMEAFF